MDETGAVPAESAAYAFHQLSSFGFFDEPVPSRTGTVVGDLPARHDRLDGTETAALAGLLGARVSQREFTGGMLDEDVLRLVLWCGYGRTRTGPVEQRTVPSAGGTYPLRPVVAACRVGSTAPGLYDVDPDSAELSYVDGPGIGSGSLGELFRTRHVPFDRAGAVVFLTGRLDSPLARYGERGYRYLLMEAGHVAQNLCLAATSLRLGQVPLGGFDDTRAGELLARHGIRQTPLYAVALGTTAPADAGDRFDPVTVARATLAAMRRGRRP